MIFYVACCSNAHAETAFFQTPYDEKLAFQDSSVHWVIAGGGLEHQCLLRNPVFKQSFQNRQKEIKKTAYKQNKTPED